MGKHTGKRTESHLSGRRIAADGRRWADGRSTYRADGTDDWLLILTTDGLGRVGLGEKELRVQAGEVILFRPHSLHDYGPHPEQRLWAISWAHFLPRPTWLAWLKWPEEAPGMMRLTIDNPDTFKQLTCSMTKAIQHNRSASRHHIELAMNALEEVILSCDQVNPQASEKPLDERVQRAMDFICLRLAEPLRVGDVAVECHLSDSRLAHLFKAQTGRGIMEFLEIQRLQLARQKLVWTEEPIAQIAYAVGFQNPFYFSRRFKSYTRLSPRAYRGTHRA